MNRVQAIRAVADKIGLYRCKLDATSSRSGSHPLCPVRPHVRANEPLTLRDRQRPIPTGDRITAPAPLRKRPARMAK
jgi:hypothetical protein